MAERSAAVDFARASLILTDEENAGEPQWLRRRSDEPLEPDAGNAAEGSGGPMPDWQCQPCVQPSMAS